MAFQNERTRIRRGIAVKADVAPRTQPSCSMQAVTALTICIGGLGAEIESRAHNAEKAMIDLGRTAAQKRYGQDV